MRRLIVLLAVLASACGSESPVAPAPLPLATLSSMGNLSVTGCTLGANNLYTCLVFSGAAQNTGSGCASGVRGLTTSYDATTRAQVASSNWSYPSVVRAGEQFGYNGAVLIVPGPLTTGWFYTTTMSWDTVKCP